MMSLLHAARVSAELKPGMREIALERARRHHLAGLAEAEPIALLLSATAKPLSLNLDEARDAFINEALLRTKNDVTEAAKLLGIGRATLYRYLQHARGEAEEVQPCAAP